MMGLRIPRGLHCTALRRTDIVLRHSVSAHPIACAPVQLSLSSSSLWRSSPLPLMTSSPSPQMRFYASDGKKKKKVRAFKKAKKDKDAEKTVRRPLIEFEDDSVMLERVHNTEMVNALLAQSKGEQPASKSAIPLISHMELKNLMGKGGDQVIVVDLRDDLDVQEEPPIEGALRMPIARAKNPNGLFKPDREEGMDPPSQQELFSRLVKLPDAQWRQKYKAEPFSKTQTIVFCSTIAQRSENITKKAIELGYNAKSLLGGIRLWNKYHNKAFEKTIIKEGEEAQAAPL